MDVNYIVVHELIKEHQVAGAKLVTSSSALPINDQTIKLIDSLNKSFQKSSILNAVFSQDKDQQEYVFPSEFRKYQTSCNEIALIDFSKRVSEDLRVRMDSITASKGGFLVFADYKHHAHFCAVFLIRYASGMIFTKHGDGYALETDVEHIDFEHLAMACRVNMDIYGKPAKTDRYLSFTSGDKDQVSRYFKQWVTLDNEESAKANTKNLHNIIKELPTPPDEHGNPMLLDRLQDKAYSIIKEAKRNVNVKHLSFQLYGDENTIKKYANEHNVSLDSEFKADTDLLNKFVDVKVKSGGLSLKFPWDQYGVNVYINKGSDDTIVIKSKGLVQKLKQAEKEDGR